MTAQALRSLPFLPVWILSIACGPPRSVESPAEVKGRAELEASESPAPAPEADPQRLGDASAAEAKAPSVSESPGSIVPGPEGSDWLTDARPSDPKRGLPEVTMRHIGMHIGGESNSDEAKRPWLKSIEREQTRILLCYRAVKDPMAGGTVGVDLYIGKAGGQPEVRRTRQHLGEADFDDCVRRAFGAVRFPAPVRPTVVSYSLRFDVNDPTRVR